MRVLKIIMYLIKLLMGNLNFIRESLNKFLYYWYFIFTYYIFWKSPLGP